ncbi:MAG: 50S ribosomal protein L20 [bacterium]
MPRVKRGKSHLKRRKKIIAQVKGYNWGRKKLLKLAKTAIIKAGASATKDRRDKKRIRRGLWQIKIGAALKPMQLNYSSFMGKIKFKNIEIDRKILSDLAENNPRIFANVAAEMKKN